MQRVCAVTHPDRVRHLGRLESSDDSASEAAIMYEKYCTRNTGQV